MYRKVITGTSPNNANEGTLATLSNIDTMAHLEAFIVITTGATAYYPYYFSSTNYGYIYYDNPNNNVMILNKATAYQNRPVTIIVEYTKTTD